MNLDIKRILEKYGVYSEELYNELVEKTQPPLNLDSLTKMEKIACQKLLQKIGDTDEATIIISKFADECGITRSVIINALKKLEATAAVKTVSLGIKGTYIRITNTKLRSYICEENGN